ncbi:MAG: radical SAM protein [Elusimicrobia bacterium]|nr:radical SAM protein [Elusimicrobiota bacterium]
MVVSVGEETIGGRLTMITFGWDLCHRCNYQCPYCGIWHDEPEKDVILSAERWSEIWKDIYTRYGECHLFISGGEPSVYPDYFSLITLISQYHVVEICTNLSWDVGRLVPLLTTDRLRIAPTFHPSQADFEDFFAKAVLIRDFLPLFSEFLPYRQIYYVAHPDQIRDMPARSKRCLAEGIMLIPLPLRGDGFVLNSEEEKRIIESLSPYSGSEKMAYQLKQVSPQGKACRAGCEYAVIRTDGTIDRCSQYHTGELGRILDHSFAFLPQPKICNKEFCPIESQWIIPDIKPENTLQTR